MKTRSNLYRSEQQVQTTSVLLVASALSLVLILFSGSPAAAQQPKQKQDNKKQPPVESSGHVLPMTDEHQIDYLISEMLGAMQIGDVDLMRKDYADDVSFVNAVWAPPIFGWNNYLANYQQQKAHMQRVRIERSNTYIKVESGYAWACYQWDFSASVDGQQAASQGQTTLVLAKRNNRWVIVHNHTSLAQAPPPGSAPPAAQPQPSPAKP